MKNEIWKDIEGFEGLYQVSNLGRIKSLMCWNGNQNCNQYKKREKILKSKPKKRGYILVTLRHKNNIKYKTVHRLVAQAFIPNPNNFPIINHINGIKTDNRVENLEWCTYEHNNKEAVRLNLVSLSKNLKRWNGKFGKEHNRSKKVYQLNLLTNEIINEFYGVKEASRLTKINSSSIYAVVLNKRKTAGGYKWRYANE